MNEIVDAGRDIRELLENLTESEKKQAYAMLQGMVIGKELAQQKEPA